MAMAITARGHIRRRAGMVGVDARPGGDPVAQSRWCGYGPALRSWQRRFSPIWEPTAAG